MILLKHLLVLFVLILISPYLSAVSPAILSLNNSPPNPLQRTDPFSSSFISNISNPTPSSSNQNSLSFAVIPLQNAQAKQVTDLIKQDPDLISPGGGISFDERTNVLMLSDSEQNLEKIKILLKSIDIPVYQILIEARIIEVEKSALKELGVTQGVNANGDLLPNMVMGNGNSLRSGVALGAMGQLANGIVNPAGALGFTLQKLPGGFLLDLQIQALESEGEAQVISSPKLMVLNNQEAVIEQGAEVPYLSAALNGATQVQFKKAVLSLKVRPEVNSNHQILLTLQVNKDKVSTISVQAQGTPVIDTREINTQVEVADGQTLVLGGIYEELDSKTTRGIPGLDKLPGLGWLFRTQGHHNQESEMLIFITPSLQKLKY